MLLKETNAPEKKGKKMVCTMRNMNGGCLNERMRAVAHVVRTHKHTYRFLYYDCMVVLGSASLDDVTQLPAWFKDFFIIFFLCVLLLVDCTFKRRHSLLIFFSFEFYGRNHALFRCSLQMMILLSLFVMVCCLFCFCCNGHRQN